MTHLRLESQFSAMQGKDYKTVKHHYRYDTRSKSNKFTKWIPVICC